MCYQRSVARHAHRAGRVVRGLWATLAPDALVVAVVALANAAFLVGGFDPNPLLTMSGLGMAVKAGALAGRFTIDPNAGTTAQSLGHLAALDLVHGHLPWWNPYEGVGAPLAGEMQSAALFPPTVLLALPQGQLLFHLVLEAAAGMATWRLLARLGTSRALAAAGGCAFALNGTFAWFAHAPVNPIACLPLVLLGVERARDAAQASRGGAFGLVAVALALSLYAGFPEVAYLDGVFALLWAIVRVAGLERGARLGFARKLAAGAAVGALLAAPIAVAFADYLPAAYLGPHAGGYDTRSAPSAGVGALFFPYVAGPVFGFTRAEAQGILGSFWIDVGGYLTTTLLGLGIMGLWSRRLRALRLGLLAWIVVALGRTYGAGPLGRIVDLLPFMGRVEAYRYLTPSIELAGVVLALLAADDLRRGDVPRRVAVAGVVVAGGCALGSLAGGRSLLHAVASFPQSHDWLVWSLAWGFGLLAATGAAAVLLRGRFRGLLTPIVCGLVVLDACAMFVVPELAAPRGGSIDTALVRWVHDHVGTQRLFTLGGLLNPNYGSYFGVQEADVNDLPMPAAYARDIESHLDPRTVPNHFDGTTIVYEDPDRAPAGSVRPLPATPVVALETGLRAYEAIGVRYVAAYRGSADAASLAALGLFRAYADPHAVVYRLPRAAPLYSAPGGSCRLSSERIGSVTADCRRPAVLVRRELWMAGWSATADGRPLLVERDGPLFQSVRLGRGLEVVRFAYVPPHEHLALWAFVAGLGVLALTWARRRPQASWRTRSARAAHVRAPRSHVVPSGEPSRRAPPKRTALEVAVS